MIKLKPRPSKLNAKATFKNNIAYPAKIKSFLVHHLEIQETLKIPWTRTSLNKNRDLNFQMAPMAFLFQTTEMDWTTQTTRLHPLRFTARHRPWVLPRCMCPLLVVRQWRPHFHCWPCVGLGWWIARPLWMVGGLNIQWCDGGNRKLSNFNEEVDMELRSLGWCTSKKEKWS